MKEIQEPGTKMIDLADARFNLLIKRLEEATVSCIVTKIEDTKAYVAVCLEISSGPEDIVA